MLISLTGPALFMADFALILDRWQRFLFTNFNVHLYRKRLFLHSFRTSFSYEWEGETHEFSAQAELPDAFNEALTS